MDLFVKVREEAAQCNRRHVFLLIYLSKIYKKKTNKVSRI